eukprot:m.304652 g.304652  ORF g.304652 m.304652 type:complete len:163 (-) comp20175_c0_seq2:1016-1504(-)
MQSAGTTICFACSNIKRMMTSLADNMVAYVFDEIDADRLKVVAGKFRWVLPFHDGEENALPAMFSANLLDFWHVAPFGTGAFAVTLLLLMESITTQYPGKDHVTTAYLKVKAMITFSAVARCNTKHMTQSSDHGLLMPHQSIGHAPRTAHFQCSSLMLNSKR